MTPEFLITSLIVVVSPGVGALYTISAGLTRGTRASLLAAAQSSPQTKVIDLGPAFAEGIRKYGQTTPTSHDGLHPNAETNRRLGEALKRLIHP